MAMEAAINWTVIGLIVTVLVFLITQIGSAIWLMATVRAQVSSVIKAIEDLKEAMKEYVPRHEIDDSHKRIWKAIEDIKAAKRDIWKAIEAIREKVRNKT